MDTFDYVIVGAGSAGCVLASRLAARGVTVCLLEAGPRDSHPLIHIPAGWMKLMRHARLNWRYATEGSEWTGGRAVQVPRGKVLGGSSSINGNVFNRGAASDFDHWAQLGNFGWGFADVLPLFKRMETWDGPDPHNLRGRDGPLRVTQHPWTHPLVEAFLDGAETVGIPRNPDYNGPQQFGGGYAQRTIFRGWRQSAATAYLRGALSRPNLELRVEAQAIGLILEGRRATGVRYQQDGQSKAVTARREVILCGGVINTPQLLQLSGIGDPDHLRRIGINLVHALPGVGQNLRDHYTPRFTARVRSDDTFNARARGPRLGWEMAKWAAGRNSILSLPSTVCYVFAKSDPVLDNSDLQITFMPASYKEGHQSQLDDAPGVTLAAWQQRPDSVGFVRARSSDPFSAPEIQPNYLSASSDRKILLAGLRLARALMRTRPMAPFFEREIYPGDAVQSDAELLECAKDRGTTTFHMIGTCKMGPESDPAAVVDPCLRVLGIAGLRVADASIMPTMPAANTNAATLLIGEKAADLIEG